MNFSRFLLIAILCLFSFSAGIPLRPQNSFVYDENRLLSAQQVDFFNKVSQLFLKKTGMPLDAILLDDIGERDARKYAAEISEKWRSDANAEGQVLIFVALKQRRKFIMTTGSAEGLLPRSSIEKIEQETLVPEFRKAHYGAGLIAFAMELTSTATQTDITAEIDGIAPPEEEPMPIRGWIFVVVIFGLLIAFGGKARRFGFFDNMKKLLSVREIENSQWPQIFQDAFGDNLVSAFLHGRCLMEGFDALDSPWTISFILKDNSPEAVAKLLTYEKRAGRENLRFTHFYSPAEIVQTLDTTPLEYLHIANRNVPLCGIKPLDGFRPHEAPLRKECAEKIRELQKRPKAELDELLPVLYGVYYLEAKSYPENNGAVLERYPVKDSANLSKTLSGILATLDNLAAEPAAR